MQTMTEKKGTQAQSFATPAKPSVTIFHISTPLVSAWYQRRSNIRDLNSRKCRELNLPSIKLELKVDMKLSDVCDCSVCQTEQFGLQFTHRNKIVNFLSLQNVDKM